MVSFTYDADGLRLTKVVDGVTHYYVWQGDRLVSESYGTSTLEFFYDESGMPYAFYFYDTASTTNNGYYYYVTNLQGDVVGIRDNSGVSKAVYQYNAWGEDIDTSGVVSDIETINPLRYRGYYYDSETKLYYLQSRYYDPVVCRFINADETDNLAANGDLASYNLYTYCGNNPVSRNDDGGLFWHIAIGAVVGAVVNVAVSYTLNTIAGNEYSLKDALVDAATGAASGALAASGVGALGQAIGNGLINMGGTALSAKANNTSAGLLDYAKSFAIGFVAGGIGGKGLAADTKVAKQLSIIDSNMHCAFRPSAWGSIKTSVQRIGDDLYTSAINFSKASAYSNSVMVID